MTLSRDIVQGDVFRRPPEADPNLFAVEPPEPYTLLIPLVPIEAGDLKRPTGEGFNWMPVEEGEVGMKTPMRGIAFARVKAPELYRLAGPDERLAPGDQVWLTSWGEWRDLRFFHDYEGLMASRDEAGLSIGGMVASQLRLHNEQMFVAKPDAQKFADHRVVNIPARHRQLYPREKLRNGDKIIYESLVDWQPVAVTAFGQAVPFPESQNGNVRYCRPVGPYHQHWYVDAATGKETNLGGQQDPWPSLDIAMKTVEAAAAKA